MPMSVTSASPTSVVTRLCQEVKSMLRMAARLCRRLPVRQARIDAPFGAAAGYSRKASTTAENAGEGCRRLG
jgi:hypothetical protein